MSRIKIWFKTNQWRFIIGFLLILIISLSFGIGYLIAKQQSPSPIIIEKNNENY